MAQDFLVSTEIEAAGDLVARLVLGGMVVAAAFWIWEDAAERWRLFIATPEAAKDWRRAVDHMIEIVHAAPDREDLLDTSFVSIVAPDHPVVRAVSQVPLRGTRRPVRVRGAVYEGTYVPDALVYKSAA